MAKKHTAHIGNGLKLKKYHHEEKGSNFVHFLGALNLSFNNIGKMVHKSGNSYSGCDTHCRGKHQQKSDHYTWIRKKYWQNRVQGWHKWRGKWVRGFISWNNSKVQLEWNWAKSGYLWKSGSIPWSDVHSHWLQLGCISWRKRGPKESYFC